MEIPTSADAMRPPNNLITFSFALAGGRPLEALSRAFEIQRELPVLPLEPRRLNAPSALSLSIAEGQICYVYRESNQSAVNRSRLAMEFGTLSICSVFWGFPQQLEAIHRPFHSARRRCNETGFKRRQTWPTGS
jgi:hypothetical protein